MNAPPAFDRRARPRVEWTFDRVSGKVDLVASGDGLEARITAASFAYAAHLTKLLLDAPPPGAFEPMPTAEQLRDPANWPVADSTTTVADATTAEPPTVPELTPAQEALEARQIEDPDGLKAGEAV